MWPLSRILDVSRLCSPCGRSDSSPPPWSTEHGARCTGGSRGPRQELWSAQGNEERAVTRAIHSRFHLVVISVVEEGVNGIGDRATT